MECGAVPLNKGPREGCVTRAPEPQVLFWKQAGRVEGGGIFSSGLLLGVSGRIWTERNAQQSLLIPDKSIKPCKVVRDRVGD